MSPGLLLDSRLLKDCEGCRMALLKRRESRDSTIQVALPYEHEPAIGNDAGCNFGKSSVDEKHKMRAPLLESC